MIVLFCPVGREESLADLHGSAWTGSTRLIKASQKVPLTFYFFLSFILTGHLVGALGN